MWGRKKFSPNTSNSPPSSSSSSSSSISSSFPSSWMSWFKSIKRRPDPDVRMANDDDESYWRLSFGKERHGAGKTSVLYNSGDQLHFSDRRKITEEFDVLRGNEEPRRRKVFKERPGEEELAEFEPIRLNSSSRRQRSISFPSTRITGEEDFVVEEGSNAVSEKHRRRRKRRRRRKSATGSPRKERWSMDRVCFDSYAVVKCSVDPRRDFRESMLEMITEKDIRQPEELQELLACYLTLNCDEHHDIIVKVFRQVWFDLNQLHFYPDL